jgi:hypothetical protein
MEAIELYELIHNLSDDYAYIAIGDTDHRDPLIKGLRADISLFKSANEAGYVAFVLENSPDSHSQDDVIKGFITGETEQELKESYEEIVAIGIDPLSLTSSFAQVAYNMKAIYPDPRYSERMVEEIGKLRAVDVPRAECDGVFFQSYINAHPESIQFLNEETAKGDDTIAQRIKEQSGGRALIIYGNGHFYGQNDINEMLAADKVVHIAAIPSREIGYKVSASSAVVPDYPDYLYVIEEDKAIPFDLDNPEVRQILDNYKSYGLETIDQATFDSCKAELTGTLKEHAVTQKQYEESQNQHMASRLPAP